MDRIRRSMLFIPGNNPGMLQNADVFDADSIILDLEDSVAIDEKDSARNLIKELLNSVKFNNVEVVIRINPYNSRFFEDDFNIIKDLPIDTILLPKADCESIIQLDRRINLSGKDINIMVLIETAEGVEKVYEILNDSKHCIGLMLGGEDLCVDLNCERTKEGMEILYARGRVINACRALKKTAVDTPFTDTNDETGLLTDTKFAKRLGFDGKASINPRQIEIINNTFNPTKEEIIYAERVIEAKDRAAENGLGVFSIDGKMVDLPIILRAEKILAKAAKIGLSGSERHEN